ncbi:MAG: T9SS type A sorting domain-containing protein [Bacteroidetes bacterium]|nr:T9SS type A sorting domain-containing protein [Bacteroidota bacterium]
MKEIIVFVILMLSAFMVSAQKIYTYLKITLDTKEMSLDYGLGGGGGQPSPCTKVYAHLGLCTCSMDGVGVTAVRNCMDTAANRQYCYQQITPWRSNVWQHVVGNWGENPQDDSVGLMTAKGNGVYEIEFIIEQYFSDPNLVSTESAGDSVVPSTPWNPAEGGAPHTIGMVFRNEDGTLSGRDNGGNDLFIINLQSVNPQIIQSTYPEVPFNAITIEKETRIEEIKPITRAFSIHPNPFSDKVTIQYYLSEQSDDLKVQIYNILGQEVRTLYSGMKAQGRDKIIWDGKNNRGSQMKSGLYVLKISSSGKVIITERLVLYK